MTVAARDGHERVTFDVGLRMAVPDGSAIRLRSGYVLVETKSGDDGGGRFDRLLEDAGAAGVRRMSLSKYRVGIGLLTHQSGDAQADAAAGYFAAA